MTHHFTIFRLGEQRALPEGLGQGLEAEGGEEAFAVAHHLELVDSPGRQQGGEVVARVDVPGATRS